MKTFDACVGKCIAKYILILLSYALCTFIKKYSSASVEQDNLFSSIYPEKYSSKSMLANIPGNILLNVNIDTEESGHGVNDLHQPLTKVQYAQKNIFCVLQTNLCV